MHETCAILSAMPGVRLVEGALSDDHYEDVLTQSFALLLPYRSDYYRARGSGILVEALSYGKVVLGSACTMIEEFLEDGVVLLCGEPAQWGAAARSLVAAQEEQSRAAEQLGVRFRGRFSARVYVERLALRSEFA
jgi:glycosyltransferase involved in cell wall biosynthesis